MNTRMFLKKTPLVAIAMLWMNACAFAAMPAPIHPVEMLAVNGEGRPLAQPQVAEAPLVSPTLPYRFADFAVGTIYKGRIARLDLNSAPEARLFRTRIREQMAEGVNFAGHYVITEVGCGTSCQQFIVTDATSGKVIETLVASMGAEFQRDSALLIIDPPTHCNPKEGCVSAGCPGRSCLSEFYEMKKGKLVELPNPIQDQNKARHGEKRLHEEVR